MSRSIWHLPAVHPAHTDSGNFKVHLPSPNLNSFLILGSWDNHEQEVESSSTNVLKGKSFPCYNCEYVATQNGHLKRHVIAKHSGERLECKSCGKKFTLKESLRRHVKEVHGNQMFLPCPECDFVGRRQDSLNYHLQWKHCEM